MVDNITTKMDFKLIGFILLQKMVAQNLHTF